LIALILAGLLTTTTRWVNWLGSSPMVYIGALSYCLYLIHNFGLNAAEMVVPHEWGFPGSLLSTALGLALAFAAAHVLHRYFEEPLRLYGVRLAHQRRRMAELPRVTEAEVERR
jgi:peptidoglycan/LPS O-acetylase OafA/YrhL